MAYEYEHDVISELEQMGVDYQSNGYFNMSIEVQEVYLKAKAFDEIVNELFYQLQNLDSWDTLDQKDCQTLKQILEENIEEDE